MLGVFDGVFEGVFDGDAPGVAGIEVDGVLLGVFEGVFDGLKLGVAGIEVDGVFDGVFDGVAEGGAPTDGLKDVDGVLLGVLEGVLDGLGLGLLGVGVTDKQIVGLAVGLGVVPGVGGGELEAQAVADLITENQVPPVCSHSTVISLSSFTALYMLSTPLASIQPPVLPRINTPLK